MSARKAKFNIRRQPELGKVSRRKAALGTFAGSAGSTLIAAIQSVVLLPLYLHAFGVEKYGLWLATGEALLWLAAFDCGIPTVMIQRIGKAHSQGRLDDIGKLFGTALAMIGTLAAVVALSVLALAPTIVSSLNNGQTMPELVLAIRIAGLAMALVLVGYVFQGLARALQHTWKLNACSLAGTALGFLTTYLLVVKGFGVASIACGLVVRASTFVVAGLALTCFAREFRPARVGFALCPEARKDYLSESPRLFSSGIAYALMNNSHIFWANLILGPAAAVLLGVTRKLAEFCKAILDMTTYAAEGGLSHLLASENPARVRAIGKELEDRFLAIAGIGLTVYVAVNTAFVPLWTKGQYHPNLLLTVAIAFCVASSAWSYAGISRLRASGEFRLASRLLLIDCLSRIVLISFGAWFGGLVAQSLLPVLPAVVCGSLARLSSAKLTPLPSFASHRQLAYTLGMLVLAVGCASLFRPVRWSGIAGVVIAAGTASASIAFLSARSVPTPSQKEVARAA